jgi:hypothetical protein
VSLTQAVANGKNLQPEKFNYFVRTPLGSRVSIQIYSILFPSSSLYGVSSLIMFLF